MQKREKIIVIITIGAALYGVVDFGLSHHEQVAAPTTSATAAQLSAKLAAVTSPDNKRLQNLARQIEKPWDNIFSRKIPDKISTKNGQQEDVYEKISEQAGKIQYTGFLEMAHNRIAIINTHDYQVGDKVDGFTLQQISPVAIKLSQSNFTFTIMAQSLPTAGGL